VKTIRIGFLFLLLIFLTLNAHADAPDTSQKIDIGIQGLGGISSKNEIQDAYGLEGSINYGLTKGIAVGFSGGGVFSRLELDKGDGTKVHGSTLTTTPLFGQVFLRSSAGSFSPYLVFGIGGLLNHADAKGEVTQNNIAVKASNGIAGKIGVGADYFASKNWFYNIELSYIFSEANIETTNIASGAVLDKKTEDFLLLSAGVNYLFD